MTQALPGGLEYSSVRWVTVGFVEDSADPDDLPDAQQVNGTVFLKPNTEYLKWLGNETDPVPKTVLRSRPSEYKLVNGVLVDKSGNTDIRIIASEGQPSAVEPEDGTWNWHCDFQLDDGFTFGSFDFPAPAGGIVDLTRVMPVAVSSGVFYAKGEKGDPGPRGLQGDPGPGVAAGGLAGQTLVKATDADYETAWVDPEDATGTAVNQEQLAAAITTHVDDTTPHPAYDDLPSLRLLFENGLV